MKCTQGIFFAPIAAAFLGTLVMCFFSSKVSSTQFAGVLFTYSLVGSVFGILSAAIFGWPLSFVFRSFSLTSWWQFCLGGLLCALPFWIAWFYPFNTGHWEAYRVSNSLYFFGVGMLAGVIYWRFVVRRQPTNKSSKKDAQTARASS